MKNLKIAALLSSILVLTGCATSKEEYLAYVEAEKAKSLAEVARYQALSNIGTKGDATASAVASIMLGIGNAGGSSRGTAPPVSAGETALRWASILVPSLTQLGTASINAGVAKRQSDNATTLGISTNETFLGMAKEIQAPGPVYSNSFNTTAPAAAAETTTAE